MAKRDGVMLLGDMSPADLVAKRKAKAPGAPPAMPDPADGADDTDGSRAAAVSALHQLAGALGVTVSDEDGAIQAFCDLVEACKSYSPDAGE